MSGDPFLSQLAEQLAPHLAEHLRPLLTELLAQSATPQSKTAAAPEYLNTKQCAAYLGMSVSSMEGWRTRGVGPAFSRIGTSVRYAKSDVDAFVASRRKGKTK